MDRLSSSDEQFLLWAQNLYPHVRLISQFTMDELHGDFLVDRISANNAPIVVPSWTVTTHEFNRRGMLGGSDRSIEWSNGGPQIAMIPAYQPSNGSTLILWTCPQADLRGWQYWDTASEEYQREVIAFCDDGSTPGGFCIYRRVHTRNARAGNHDVRLGGWVRNAGGSKSYFGGSMDGIASAQLIVDTVYRVGLSQGPAGAKLFLNDTEVATLPAVTVTWQSLSTPILLGCTDEVLKPYLRSPYWGRMDNVEVYAGQMALADVALRPAPVQSLLWKVPTDFGLYAIGTNATVQQDMDAASAATQYLYQDPSDTTVYVIQKSADPANTCVQYRDNCPGIVGARLQKLGGAANAQWNRLINLSDPALNAGGQMGVHGDPYVASGGYKLIGCHLDGNARAMDWHPWGGATGYSYVGQDPGTQQGPVVIIGAKGQPKITVTIDACHLFDNTGDAISMYVHSDVYIRSTKCYGTFRGGIVKNNTSVTCDARRFETIRFSRNGIDWAGNPPGAGIDIEPFEASIAEDYGGTLVLADGWLDSDYEDANRKASAGPDYAYYYNMHVCAGGPLLSTTGDYSHDDPINIYKAYGCTFSFHHHFGNYPPCWLNSLSGTDGTGHYHENCVFLASGETYNYHEAWEVTPNSSNAYGHVFTKQGDLSGPRWLTLVDSEFRAKNLPSGLATSNVRIYEPAGGFSTAESMYFDNVRIGPEFADVPINMSGMTIYYRDMLHERTGDTTPWTNAGAAIPI